MKPLTRTLWFAVLLMVLTSTASPASAQEGATATPSPGPIVQPTYTPLPTYTPYPTYTPLPTYTPYPTPTPLPSDTPAPTLIPTQTPTLTPTSSVPPYDVLANCEEFDEAATGGTVAAGTPVRIFWGWIVTEPQYIEQQLEYAAYNVSLDGQPLSNYAEFRGPLRWYPTDNGWGVYWYVPVGLLQPGAHRVTYTITWSRAVDDGWVKFGPGTQTETITSGCSFTVQ